MFWRLSQEAEQMMRENPAHIVSNEINELRDELDLLAEMSDWPKFVSGARSLIDRLDNWRTLRTAVA